MLLIPAFVILIVYGEMGWALLAFLVAGITDALDGLIARWTGQKTTLGAWLDPTAGQAPPGQYVHRADAAAASVWSVAIPRLAHRAA
jgi:hypothetical protein